MKDKIVRFLREAEAYCSIKFAYIFGSYARGENSENSDIDFAFMINDSLSKIDEVFARGNLIELGKGIFKRDVDVVFLNCDLPLLKYEIIKDGVVIKDHDERIAFESLSIREYFDYKYYSDYYDKCLLERIKNN